jgi:hypothetical protein
VEDIKKEFWRYIENAFTYLFVSISAIIALLSIYRSSLVFFDPLQMSASLQMFNLSEQQIVILDVIEISIYVALFILIVIGAITKYKKLMIWGSVSLWVVILVFCAIIEPFFWYKII